MRIVAYLAAMGLGLLGLLFLLAVPHTIARMAVAVLLLCAAATLVFMVRSKVPHSTTTVVQRIELGGDMNLEQLKCRSCGGSLNEKALSVQQGAVFVTCPFCESSYQMEEAPKW